MSSLKIITESAKLDAHIVGINKTANKLNADLQIGLASATLQAVQHGNTNHLNALHHAGGKGVRRTALAQWILAFAPVVIETDAEKAKDNPYRFSREKLEKLLPEANPKAVTAEEAIAYAEVILGNDWTAYKEPPLVPEKWNVADALAKVIATAKSMQSKKVHIEHAEILGKLADLMPQAETQPASL